MKHFFIIFSAVLCLSLSACVQRRVPRSFQYTPKTQTPRCHQETMIAVYDEQGTFQLPGCVNYTPAPESNIAPSLSIDYDAPNNTLETSGDYFEAPINSLETSGSYSEPQTPQPEDTPEVEEEINPDDIPGEFPSVFNNKYAGNQVVMQNLNTRVLAYCRGTEEQIETCVERLQNSCYKPITEIPQMSGKYDALQSGTYPTRRWRKGEYVPRW